MKFTHGEVQKQYNKKGVLGNQTGISSKNQKIPRIIQSLKNKEIIDISMGNHHMGAVTKNGEVYTWGHLSYGKLGHSLDILNPELDLTSTSGRSSIDKSKIKIPKKIEKIPKAKKVLCKYNNTFILTEEGEVLVLGSFEKGINGTGRKREAIEVPEKIKEFKNKKITSLSGGNNFCLALDDQGKVYSWGLNNYGQLGEGDSYVEDRPVKIEALENSKIIKISCGENFAMALNDQGKVFSWGMGNCGQLGHGNKEDIKTPMVIHFEEEVCDISCGDTHSAFLTRNGEVFVFGNGKEGQMGRGGEVESSAGYRVSPMGVNFFKDNGLRVNSIFCGGYHNIAQASYYMN